MNQPDQKYVFHGSSEQFKTVVPKRQKRGRMLADGSFDIFFDEVSFHATPYKWIAIAYTCDYKELKINGETARYKIGLDLYEYKEELEVLGFYSLEDSLVKLYGDGGYLFYFKNEHFFHTKGLGNFEVITKENLLPEKVERVINPIAELKKLNIAFKFIDLAKPENAKFWS